MTQRSQYLTGVVIVTPVWFVISFWLTLMLASAEDTMPLDLPVPMWLKLAFSIFVPVYYLLQADHTSFTVFMLAMFINSLLSAFMLIFLLRIVARFVTTKKREVTNAA